MELERRERDIAHRRRNPLYWGDRLLSLLLGFPSYLVGKIIGVPASRIDATPWGTILRVAELAAAGLGVYLGGRNAGWW
jgi:hypothetical protein